jgi:O-antigen ligase
VPLVLLAIGVNAVLIQTVIPEESQMKNVIRVGCLAVLVFAMFLDNARMPLWAVLTLLMCTALFIARGNTDQLSYIFVLLLAPAMLALDEQRVMRWLAVASVGALALVFAFLQLGITHNVVLALRNRQTFGTDGVPFFYNLVYGAGALVILYTRKYWWRGRFLALVACLAGASWLFLATDARGGYFSLLAFVGLLFIVPVLARLHLFRLLVALLPFLFLPFAFYLASRGGSFEANKLWSNRPRFYAIFLSALRPDDYLFSTSVKYFDRVVTIVDNSYLHLLVGGGIVLFGVFAVLFYRASMNLFRLGRHAEIAFLIATCFYFNSESILLRIENLFVIYFWYLIVRFSTNTEEGIDLEHEHTNHGRGHAVRRGHRTAHGGVERDHRPHRAARDGRHDARRDVPMAEGSASRRGGLASPRS